MATTPGPCRRDGPTAKLKMPEQDPTAITHTHVHDGPGQSGELRRTPNQERQFGDPLRCWVNGIHDPLLIRPCLPLLIFK
jgi:hypothetical protein